MRSAKGCAITAPMRTDQLPLRIALFAPDGRMGRAIADAIAAEEGFAIDNDHGDVLIDFSALAMRCSANSSSPVVPTRIGMAAVTARSRLC